MFLHRSVRRWSRPELEEPLKSGVKVMVEILCTVPSYKLRAYLAKILQVEWDDPSPCSEGLATPWKSQIKFLLLSSGFWATLQFRVLVKLGLIYLNPELINYLSRLCTLQITLELYFESQITNYLLQLRTQWSYSINNGLTLILIDQVKRMEIKVVDQEC